MYYFLVGNVEESKYGEISNFVVEEKKSKFYAYVFNINNKDDALNKIEDIRKKNKEARHIVYIYNIIENGVKTIKFSDDGEPKGTGTRAIYDLLEKEGIVNILIVIVRIFGGALLGAGLLSRTYLNAAKNAITSCKKEILYNYVHITKEVPYSKYETQKNKLEELKSRSIISNIKVKYSDSVTLDFDIIDLYIPDLGELT